MTRYGILGPLLVADGSVTAGRDRIVLAMLLLQPGRVIGTGDIIAAVWGDEPPPTARGQLQSCVSRLRRVLPAGAITSDPAGYRIDVPPGELDASLFARLIAEGRQTKDPALFRQALDLWRGDALTGLDTLAVRVQAAALDEQRLAATEEWADLELAAGRHRDLIGELSTLVERFPLREGLRGRLITALHRAGRPADALAEFQRARRVLRDELGIDPGPELRELHQQVLAGTVPPPSSPAAPVRCLPRTVHDFTGRAEVADRLVAALSDGSAIAVIDGMAGSGKTTLALHVAALIGDRHPDAHLFIDLHGHSERAPVDPSAALLALLRQLGVPAERIPSGHGERVDLWRTELAARRALVVLDNAASSAQVTDLLPGSPGSLALVTSRRRLAGLDGVHSESLPLLTEEEALTLLARIAGDRVTDEPGAALEVVRRCGALPLALRLAGARLAHRPRWRMADLVRRIGDSALPELAVENRTVAGAFAVSFGQLPAAAQRMFRLLGVHPGEVLDAPAVAALGDLPLHHAFDVLDDLEDVHLIEEPEPGVFRLHDLLREYAAALAEELPAAERHEAVTRALDFELHAALATVQVGRRPQVLRDLAHPAPLRPDLVPAPDEAADRLERVRPDVRALIDAAVAAGRPRYAWQLPRAVWSHLWSRGYTEDIAELFTVAREVARRAGEPVAQAMAGNYLASAHFLRGRYDEALTLMLESIRLREEAGDLGGLSIMLGNVSAVYNATSRFGEGLAHARRALQLADRHGDGLGMELILDSLATSCSALGRHDEAIRYERRRLQLVIPVRDELRVLQTLEHLVTMRRRAGTIAPAAAERVLRFTIRRMIHHGYGTGESDGRAELGDLLREQGRHAEAINELRLSLAKSEEVGDARSVAAVLNTLGRAQAEAGDRAAAVASYRRALDMARDRSQPLEQGRAALGLGDCAADDETARAHWRAAHQIFTRLGVPEQFTTAARLGGGADHLRTAAGGETIRA